jgi:hypothetical protein
MILAQAKARRGMPFKQYQTEEQRRPAPKAPRHRRDGICKHTLVSRLSDFLYKSGVRLKENHPVNPVHPG